MIRAHYGARMRWKMGTILSIDWDNFFGGADDVSHGCLSCSWLNRGCNGNDEDRRRSCRPVVDERSHVFNGVLPPRDRPIDSIKKLELAYHRELSLFVAECHADILDVIADKDTVVNIDAHSDDGSFGSEITCGNWADHAYADCKISYYWVGGVGDLGTDILQERIHHLGKSCFDKVFICQSRPWTPVGWDRMFYDFVAELGVRLGVGEISVLGPERERIAKNTENACRRLSR